MGATTAAAATENAEPRRGGRLDFLDDAERCGGGGRGRGRVHADESLTRIGGRRGRIAGAGQKAGNRRLQMLMRMLMLLLLLMLMNGRRMIMMRRMVMMMLLLLLLVRL